AATFGADAGWNMGISDAALGLILVLAARAAAAERIPFQIVRSDVDLDIAFNFRNDVDGCQRGMPTLIGVEGADADETVHAAFALQVAVSIIAEDSQRSAADACFLIAQLVDQLRLKAVTLRPARIKAQEHH